MFDILEEDLKEVSQLFLVLKQISVVSILFPSYVLEFTRCYIMAMETNVKSSLIRNKIICLQHIEF